MQLRNVRCGRGLVHGIQGSVQRLFLDVAAVRFRPHPDAANALRGVRPGSWG
jgi:hypothetical protein